MKKFISLLIVPLLVTLFIGSTASGEVINFDSISAPCCFSSITPGGPHGPSLVYPSITFDGGVIMNGDSGWSGLQTSDPNLYGTSDFLELADDSNLPGYITGTFNTPVDTLSLDVINGFGASTFHVEVYDLLNALIGSVSVALPAFPNPLAVGSASFDLSNNIKWFKVSSGQTPGAIDFAIDTVAFNVPVPEPGTIILLGFGLIGILGLRRRN